MQSTQSDKLQFKGTLLLGCFTEFWAIFYEKTIDLEMYLLYVQLDFMALF